MFASFFSHFSSAKSVFNLQRPAPSFTLPISFYLMSKHALSHTCSKTCPLFKTLPAY